MDSYTQQKKLVNRFLMFLGNYLPCPRYSLNPRLLFLFIVDVLRIPLPILVPLRIGSGLHDCPIETRLAIIDRNPHILHVHHRNSRVAV